MRTITIEITSEDGLRSVKRTFQVERWQELIDQDLPRLWQYLDVNQIGPCSGWSSTRDKKWEDCS
jgi:hypothetical protein